MKPTYDELLTTNEQLRIEIQKLQADLTKQQNLLKLALERIVALEESIKKNSQNSSKPPSSDRKANTQKPDKKKRPPRQGINRALIAPENVDHFVDCTLTHCPDCGSNQLYLNGNPESLQQVELPEVKAVVTQFNCFRYSCSCCGSRSTANLPTGIPNSAFGPRLMAITALLTGEFLLAKRDVMALLKNLYGVDICEGSVINVEERVGEALADIYLRIHRVVMECALCKHFDETSWRNQGKNSYVWVASTSRAVCFRIDAHRSKNAFLRFMNHLSPAPVVTDRYAVYNDVSKDHQYCLAHLIRDFKKYGERDGLDGEIGQLLEKELRDVCRIHRRYRRDEISLRSRNHRLRYSKKRMEYHLIDGLANCSSDFGSFCENVLDRFERLWTFAKFSDVEPTNNLAERDLRRIVLHRKKSYGTRSERGQRFVERIQTVCGTLKRTGQNLFQFMERAVSAFYRREEAPFIQVACGY